MRNVFSKKIIGATLGLIIIASPLSASAQTSSKIQLKSEQHTINQQTSKLSTEMQANKDQIHKLTGKITKTQITIGQNEAQMTSLNKQISETQARIKKRTDLLKQQVKATYISGSGRNMLTVLLDANNFTDFVNRAYAVYKITNQQQSLINQQNQDEKKLQKAQDQLKAKSEQTKKSLLSLKQYASDLQNTVQKQQKQMAALKNKSASVKAEIASLSVSTIQPSQVTTHTSSSSQSTSASSVPAVTIPAAAVSGSVADIIHNAQRYIGNSTYVFGGGRNSYDIAHGLFDCSGFVHWAYDSIGLDLGGWTTSSLQYVGTPVSPSNMKPGDLVFFNTYEANGHVGIYIGNGEFIGSQDSTGVAIASLNSSYWSSHFSGTVRRILN